MKSRQSEVCYWITIPLSEVVKRVEENELKNALRSTAIVNCKITQLFTVKSDALR